MNLGRIGLSPTGPYSETTLYRFLDVVSHDNKLWVYKGQESMLAAAPTVASPDWMLGIDGGIVAGSGAEIALNSKVDKVLGKELSDNNYTDADVAAVAELITAFAANKVLSDTNYTAADKTLVDTIVDKVSKEVGKGLSTNDFTAAYKTLLDNLQAGTAGGLSSNDYTNADKAAVATIVDKVSKEVGKGLSTNDYTNADKATVDAVAADIALGKVLSTFDYTDADKTLVNSISGKVDSVPGKGLSTNDFTDALKTKLDGLSAGGGGGGTGSDNNYTNADKALVDTIINKVDKSPGKGLSANDFTNALKTKLDAVVLTDNNFTNALKAKLDGLGPQIRTVSFHQVGPLVIGLDSNRFVPTSDMQLVKYTASIGVLGTSSVTVKVRRSGTEILQITIPQGQYSVVGTTTATVASDTFLQFEVVASSNAINLTVNLDYEKV